MNQKRSTGRHPRLALVLSHPTQYYSPWFRWLAAHTQITPRVFYLWDFGVQHTFDPLFNASFKWDVDLLSGYGSEFVPNVATDPGTHHFRGLQNPSLTSRLAAWRPDAILLFGYAYASHLRALAWARAHRVPMIFRGDSHLLGRSRPRFLTRVALRLLYSQFKAVTYVGTANREYFATLGVPARRLFFAPHCVDDSRFDPAAAGVREQAAHLRSSLRIDVGSRVLLFAGKLVPAKQPLELLEAFLGNSVPNTALVFVGDGELQAALRDRARSAAPGTIHFLPFANQSEMPIRYLLGDVFALPSRGLYETWGLAVNEAMHMGRPAIVSDRVGCQRDLVTPNETGWVFPAQDYAELKRQVARALTDDLGPYRDAVARRIQNYTYARAADGLQKAVDSLGLAHAPS